MTNGFDINSPFLGSTNYYNITPNNPNTVNCQDALSTGLLQSGNNYPNWLATVNNVVDLRYAYVTCCPNNSITVDTSYCTPFGTTFGQNTTWPDPTVNG